MLRQLWHRLRFGRPAAPLSARAGLPTHPPHPANVPGPFYVEDGCCISCGVWEIVAPDLLAWASDGSYSQCYVSRQPETEDEFGRMMEAMEVGDADCIRVHACKPAWMNQLRQAGFGHHIDPPSGPLARKG